MPHHGADADRAIARRHTERAAWRWFGARIDPRHRPAGDRAAGGRSDHDGGQPCLARRRAVGRRWPAQAIGRAAPLLLLLGAAGGLQSLTQTAHMAELLAERLLPLQWGLALPFVGRGDHKNTAGSSLVAAITTAGMVQPLLPALGLDGENRTGTGGAGRRGPVRSRCRTSTTASSGWWPMPRRCGRHARWGWSAF
ncbi:MAG: hypothetical protein WDN04_19135 [Rhodospirillales bacterium]